MADAFSLILNATFTGLGVAIGNELWSFFKTRRQKIQDFLDKQTGVKRDGHNG